MGIPILLGHNDVLLRLEREGDHWPFLVGSDDGHIDLPRARAGGLAGGFFAVWVPHPEPDDEVLYDEDGSRYLSLAPPLDPEYVQNGTLSMTYRLLQLERDSEGEVAIVRSKAELARCLRDEVFAAILHFEGAEAIYPDLRMLEEFYEHGLRSLGICWSRPNAYGHGVQFGFPVSPDTGPGLTRAGEQLVRACNQLGIMLDVSHLTAEGFWDVARVSRHPLVATHSNAFALCPSSRNLTDDQLQAIADTGGLVGINFGTSDLRSDGEDDPDTPLELIYHHLEYVAELVGIEHVALGSDFEGTIVSHEVGDASDLGYLLLDLERRGFSSDDLAKLAYGNWLRVLDETWID